MLSSEMTSNPDCMGLNHRKCWAAVCHLSIYSLHESVLSFLDFCHYFYIHGNLVYFPWPQNHSDNISKPLLSSRLLWHPVGNNVRCTHSSAQLVNMLVSKTKVKKPWRMFICAVFENLDNVQQVWGRDNFYI